MTSIMFFLFFVPLLGFILLNLNFFLAPHRPYKEKKTPFECGYHSFTTQNRTPFTVSFYIFAMLFLLFDIEITTVFPFVVSSNFNGPYGFSIVISFILILTLGFVFELGKNALKIDTKQDKSTLNSCLFFVTPPKPHAFVSLPLQSSIGWFKSHVKNILTALLLVSTVFICFRLPTNTLISMLLGNSLFFIIVSCLGSIILTAFYCGLKGISITKDIVGLTCYFSFITSSVIFSVKTSIINEVTIATPYVYHDILTGLIHISAVYLGTFMVIEGKSNIDIIAMMENKGGSSNEGKASSSSQPFGSVGGSTSESPNLTSDEKTKIARLLENLDNTKANARNISQMKPSEKDIELLQKIISQNEQSNTYKLWFSSRMRESPSLRKGMRVSPELRSILNDKLKPAYAAAGFESYSAYVEYKIRLTKLADKISRINRGYSYPVSLGKLVIFPEESRDLHKFFANEKMSMHDLYKRSNNDYSKIIVRDSLTEEMMNPRD